MNQSAEVLDSLQIKPGTFKHPTDFLVCSKFVWYTFFRFTHCHNIFLELALLLVSNFKSKKFVGLNSCKIRLNKGSYHINSNLLLQCLLLPVSHLHLRFSCFNTFDGEEWCRRWCTYSILHFEKFSPNPENNSIGIDFSNPKPISPIFIFPQFLV